MINIQNIVLHHAFVDREDNTLEVREFSSSEISTSFIADWANLESRSLESNIYLSPYFCLPAIKELAPGITPTIIAIYNSNCIQPVLLGVAIVVLCPPCRDFPFKHLMCFESIHSYLSGLLLDRTQADVTALKFFEYLTKANAPWHGLRINHWFSSGVQGNVMHSAAKAHGINWQQFSSYERAYIEPAKIDKVAYQKSYQLAGGKDLDRRIRRLRELGEVSTRVARGTDVTSETVERFISLEDREWTRKTKTSLLAAGHDDFFRTVCQPLIQESRIFVSEVLINGKPIASAFNFISGDCGFAFKIGWDQNLAKMSPGIINEIWFMQDIALSCGDLKQIDSGASEGSFIEKIWPSRKTISSGIFITTRRAQCMAYIIDVARTIKNRLGKFRPQ